MKKGVIILAVVQVLLFLIGCGNSEKSQISTDIDLSTLTDEEIVTLNKDIQREITARNIEKSAVIVHGEYTIGKDIPAGSYRFYSKVDDKVPMIFSVYPEGSKRAGFSQVVNPGEEDTWGLSLNDGDLIVFTSGEITLTVSTGINFK